MQHLTLNISLNTVLTVISLIDPGLYGSFRFSSQYRSHGYLFNQYKFTTQDGQERRLNTVLTVISLIQQSATVCLTLLKSQYRSHGYLFNQNVLEGTRD